MECVLWPKLVSMCGIVVVSWVKLAQVRLGPCPGSRGVVVDVWVVVLVARSMCVACDWVLCDWVPPVSCGVRGCSWGYLRALLACVGLRTFRSDRWEWMWIRVFVMVFVFVEFLLGTCEVGVGLDAAVDAAGSTARRICWGWRRCWWSRSGCLGWW